MGLISPFDDRQNICQRRLMTAFDELGARCGDVIDTYQRGEWEQQREKSRRGDSAGTFDSRLVAAQASATARRLLPARFAAASA
jgi:hypothetical protein